MSSKRRRVLKNAQRSHPPDTDLSLLLTCVRVVYLKNPDTLLLPHVAAKLDEFLDGSPKWTLARACAANSLDLVRRILARLSLEPATSSLRCPGFRSWQFEASMMKAAAVGNLDVVKLLGTHFKKCLVTGKVVIEAARRGHMEILTWINAKCQFVDWSKGAVTVALLAGHLEMAKWLQANTVAPSLYVLEKCAVIAVKKGDFELLKWVCSLDAGVEGGAQRKVHPWWVVNCVVGVGHLEMLKWIFEQSNGTVQTLEEDDVTQEAPRFKIQAWLAVRSGHFDVLKWLVPKHQNRCCFDAADVIAAETGRLDILRWLWANNLVNEPRSSALSMAAKNGHLHILKWLVAQDRRYNCSKSMYEAARNGHVQVVKWLHENTPTPCAMAAIDAAAAHGHLDIVTFLHENSPPVRSTNSAIIGAAAHGHLDIVKFLHGIRHGGGHFDAMAVAVENGHLEVAKWLNDNKKLSNSNIGNTATIARLSMPARAGNLDTIQWSHTQQLEGFTSEVMNAAAGNGHLDIVKWLHANRTEGCTTKAMDLAASNNHFAVVKWLHENRTEGCTTSAMDLAAYHRRLEMIQWLNENRSEGCSGFAMKIAIKTGNFEVAWYLHQARSSCDIITALKECSNKSICCGFTEWVYIHHREEFESTVAIHLSGN